jgi:hypothetical protein
MMPTGGATSQPAAVNTDRPFRRPPGRQMLRAIVPILLPATILCLLNAAKPLVMDDPAYYAYASHIADHPLDQYGFTIFWYQHPLPAFEVLAPPVLPYWWALGLHLFGDSPLLWKFWLWPWCILLATALDALLRRFARPHDAPLLWMLLLSPALLPAFNLMLDVPSLALSLAAVACFLGGIERGSWFQAVGAGVLAGLAMQTKYTALVTPPALLWAAWCGRSGDRWRPVALGLLAVGTAVALFSAWEVFVAAKYGNSHFLHHVTHHHTPWLRKLNLFWPFIGLLGAVGAPLGLLALAAWGAPTRWITGVGALYIVGLGLFALVPGEQDSVWSITHLVFGLSGLITAVSVAAIAAWFLMRRCGGGRWGSHFLAGWWLLEVAGAFVLSPWPAARRVLGTVVVGTLLSGALASHTCRTPGRQRLVRGVVLFGVALGLLMQAVDCDDAAAEQEAVEQVAAWAGARDPGAVVWFVGHWGVQFYAERAGWRPVDPDRSLLRSESWLVVPARDSGGQRIDLPPQAVYVWRFDRRSHWPVSTIPWYHGTNTVFHRLEGPVLSLDVYRITADCVPKTAAGGGQLGP